MSRKIETNRTGTESRFRDSNLSLSLPFSLRSLSTPTATGNQPQYGRGGPLLPVAVKFDALLEDGAGDVDGVDDSNGSDLVDGLNASSSIRLIAATPVTRGLISGSPFTYLRLFGFVLQVEVWASCRPCLMLVRFSAGGLGFLMMTI
ncbi:hypothetical protein RHSIM_Rhsim06G0010900 [Rhododendron simsii]|uniref:Uncharacterized protein n=1 Tax=Rhododendron simsii TaxID=118357 RepID=A0A834GUH9_RHOSS|nr:hypothetical protein RHSIM_Rhsim06G0010900 [Rhododendron simsii]